MKRWKIVSIIGTRPEVIKMAPVIKEMEKYKKRIDSITIGTGQHREILQPLLQVFKLKIHKNLNVMTKNQTLFSISEKVIKGMGVLLGRLKPDLVLVQGDTVTAFLGALCASYLKIPIGHVEAGLRSFDRFHPFPEEMNRRLISCLADLNFAPTQSNVSNLRREGVPKASIFLTGNPVIDTLKYLMKSQQKHLLRYWNYHQYLDKNSKLIVVTAHRRENWGTPLRNICRSIQIMASQHTNLVFLFPVHPNPNVRKIVFPMLSSFKNVHLTDPLPYQAFVEAMTLSHVLLTDSGGIQEEGPLLGKPVLVLRKKTERPEAVVAGAVKLIGTNTQMICKSIERLLSEPKLYKKMSLAISPYGDGAASKRITSKCLQFLNQNTKATNNK